MSREFTVVKGASGWAGGEPTRYLALAGRVLYAAIFLVAAPGHFSAQEIGYAAHQGVPLAGVAVPPSGILALGGGPGGLPGYKNRIRAGLLGVFPRPVPPAMRN